MTPDRLSLIRAWSSGRHSIEWLADAVPELLDHIDELTRQRDDARRIAAASGYFQDVRDEIHEYPPNCDPPAPLELRCECSWCKRGGPQ